MNNEVIGEIEELRRMLVTGEYSIYQEQLMRLLDMMDMPVVTAIQKKSEQDEYLERLGI